MSGGGADVQKGEPAAAVVAEKQLEAKSTLDEADLKAISHERYLRRNMSFAEQKPPGLWGKLVFTSKSRMKALLTKNILQLVRQPS